MDQFVATIQLAKLSCDWICSIILNVAISVQHSLPLLKRSDIVQITFTLTLQSRSNQSVTVMLVLTVCD